MSNLMLRQTLKAAVSVPTRRQHLHHIATAMPTTRAFINRRTLHQSIGLAKKLPTTKPAISALAKAQLLHRAIKPISPTTASVNRLALDQWDAAKMKPYPSLQFVQPPTSEDAYPAMFGHILENRVVLNLITTECARQRALMEVGEMLCMVSLSVFGALRKKVADFMAPNFKPTTFMDIMLGGGPPSTPWKDEETVSDKDRKLEENTVSFLPVEFG